jgi:hypothetical protein
MYLVETNESEEDLPEKTNLSFGNIILSFHYDLIKKARRSCWDENVYIYKVYNMIRICYLKQSKPWSPTNDGVSDDMFSDDWEILE